ncbi:hypothetical protein Slin15195_G070310 [Septoria linicola]|uniref:Uncharacterized protein n=1 Tax=Septoria linicola TaxID=215465 RepID=A0A9Q9AXF9_9PEZI|nr:hypothetical protein Slin14017_G103060 [Septoria linicola]USW53712.1 hypothetical protein Slin15195_G070310 [Septoria linicola]
MSQELSRKRKAECEPCSPRPAKIIKQNQPLPSKATSPEQKLSSKANAATLPYEILSNIFSYLIPECEIPHLGGYANVQPDAHSLPSGSILRVNKLWMEYGKAYFTEIRQDILSAFYCRSGIRKNKLLDARKSCHTFDLRPATSDHVFSNQHQTIRFEAVFTKHDREKSSLRVRVIGIALPDMASRMPKNKDSILLVEAENMDDPANDDCYTHIKYCELYTPQQIWDMVTAIKKAYFDTPTDAPWLSAEARQGLQRKITVLNNIGGMIAEGLADQAELGDEAVGMDAMDAQDCYMLMFRSCP